MKNILDDVFKRPEPEVRKFSELMRTPVEAAPTGLSGVDWAKRGGTERIAAFVPQTQQSGGILIQHGWNGTDYVWNIEPAPRRRWKVSLDRVIYAVAKTMNQTVPPNVRVNIFRPARDWEVKILTFRAYGLGECWNVRKRDVEEMTIRVFSVLNPLV